MAATSNYYLDKAIKEGSTEANAKMALLAIPDDDNETLKDRYYLDVTLVRAKSGEDGELINKGFTGGCIIGSPNYHMHAVARHHTLRDIKGNDVVFFNDAGLNTLGEAISVSITNLSTGAISFLGTFLSAFHVNSDNAGFKYKRNSQEWVTVNTGSIDQKVQVNRNHSLNPLALIKAGDTIYLKGFVTNAEGTNETSEISGIVTAFTTSAMFTTGWPSTASNPTTIYAKESHTFTAFYTNSATTNLAPNGYYVFNGMWYQQGVIPAGGGAIGIIAQGRAVSGEWPTGDPANPSVESRQWWGFSTVSRQAAIDNIQPNPLGTMYRNPSNSLWYTAYNPTSGVFTGLVPTGFYAQEGGITFGFVNGELKPPNWNG